MDLVAGLGAGLHGAAPGDAQQPDRFHLTGASLGSAQRLTGKHGAGRTDGVGLVGLPVAAAMLPVRAHHLSHIDALSREVAGYAGTPRAGPLHPNGDDLAMRAHPAPQLPVADSRGRERLGADQTSELVEHCREVNVLVRVDAAEHVRASDRGCVIVVIAIPS